MFVIIDSHFRKLCQDGQRPICRPCQRLPTFRDCDYPGPEESQLLEEQIARLTARINEIERSDATGPSVISLSPIPTGISRFISLPSISQTSQAFSRFRPRYCACDLSLSSISYSACLHSFRTPVNRISPISPTSFQLGRMCYAEYISGA